jgi:uridine kinase
MRDKIICQIAALARKEARFMIAIDGGSGAGKSTFAAELKSALGANLFHMDDFFLAVVRKTPERLAQPGGNTDWERFLQEVLIPLSRGRPFEYRPFDCCTQTMKDSIAVAPASVSIIEGVYCQHPMLRPYYHLKIWMSVQTDIQRDRIRQRSGEKMLERYLSEWIPMEENYFSACHICQHADIQLCMKNGQIDMLPGGRIMEMT